MKNFYGVTYRPGESRYEFHHQPPQLASRTECCCLASRTSSFLTLNCSTHLTDVGSCLRARVKRYPEFGFAKDSATTANINNICYDLCNILSWTDAHANLPIRARWIPKANVAPCGASNLYASALQIGGIFLFSDSVIDPATIQAYLETHYRLHGEEPFFLHIGQVSSDLLFLYERHKV
jgi:hypothetical protein